MSNTPEISMEDHLALLHRLHRLESAVQAAIDMVSQGNLRPTSPAEAEEHAKRFGTDAWLLGDFVIIDRKAPPCAPLPPAGVFGEWIAP